MEVKEMLKFLENKEKELSTYKETDKEVVRKLCTDKNKKIVEFNEIYAIENILNRLEQLEKENERLEQNNQEMQKEAFVNSIPKSVIREKIKEIEKEYIKWDAYEDSVKLYLLKELLGDEQ